MILRLTLVSPNNDPCRVQQDEIAAYFAVSNAAGVFTQLTLKGSGTSISVQESVEAIDGLISESPA